MMTGPDGNGEAQINAIYSNNQESLELIEKGIRKIRSIVFGKTHSKTLYQKSDPFYNCRLTFIRLNWKHLFQIFLKRWKFNPFSE